VTLQEPPSNPLDRELLVKQFISIDQIHVNVTQAVIVTTEDKVELCLNRHMKQLESRQAWVAPFGILLALGTTLLTSSFKDFILPAQAWHALFILAGIGSLVWLVASVLRARGAVGVSDVINDLKLGNATLASKSLAPKEEISNAR